MNLELHTPNEHLLVIYSTCNKMCSKFSVFVSDTSYNFIRLELIDQFATFYILIKVLIG